ncbi:MAG: sulfatase-like hydrolase/transferase [Bacteroidales bacterium]|nr:sulfatase-like hydrolase/transferase [Bacteroidales bacterium]
MKNYLYHIKLFFQRFLILIAIFSISRILFYCFNINYFNSIGFFEFIRILLGGIRFDISALFYFNIIFILLSLIPGDFKNNKIYQKILFSFFLIINILLLATNFIDTKFFDFENKRLTSDIFSGVWLGEDFKTLLPQFIKDYWYLIILWILSTYLIVKVYPKLKEKSLSKKSKGFKQLTIQIGIFILILGFGLLGGRGGFQLKPLRTIHATDHASARNIPLVLNSPFTIMKSFGSQSLISKNYLKKDALDSIYNPIHVLNSPKNNHNTNIVVVILESFSKEYIGYLNNGFGYTPFLDSLMNKSLVFPNAYANGKKSIEAITSIAAGIPSLQNNPYITSKYSSNTIKGLPEILNNLGYHTSFFHGGKNGTMGFDQFARLSGYKEYYGMSEFDNPAYFDGQWGIFDEEFLSFWEDKLTEFKKPFFSTIFTLTSHHPYPIPEKYKDRFPKGNLKIHETIGYTDFALKQFFKSAKKTEWFKNTLFIFVADHTAQVEKAEYKNKLGMYSIPIFFYHPTDTIFLGNSEYVAQQTDIFPTILDYISYKEPFICFGNSLLNDSTSHFSINYINGIYQLIEGDYTIQFDGNNTIGVYYTKEDKQLKNNLINSGLDYTSIENKIKAIIQSYQERMIHNKLTLE